jgi:hypothetical protein
MARWLWKKMVSPKQLRRGFNSIFVWDRELRVLGDNGNQRKCKLGVEESRIPGGKRSSLIVID